MGSHVGRHMSSLWVVRRRQMSSLQSQCSHLDQSDYILTTFLVQMTKVACLAELYPKSTAAAATSNDANWAQLMDQGFKDFQPSLSEVFLILWGKGGRASVGWTHSWYGPGGAKERTHRVSGAVFRKLKKKAEIFDVLSKTYGIMDEKDLVTFNHNVPHTETNLSPTWPVCFNRMPHRFGAVAHTWVEYDNDPTLAARINATIHYTGSDDGVITHRNQLAKGPPVPLSSAQPADYEEDEEVDSVDNLDSDNENNDNGTVNSDEDNPAPSSQTFTKPPSAAVRTLRLPRPTPSPIPTAASSSTPLALSPFMTSKCMRRISQVMTIFTHDEVTADSYAYWAEHRSKLLFHVPMQAKVFKSSEKRMMSKVEPNLHEEMLATNNLTHYAKSECPVDLHADFHSQMIYANFPAALVTNVINQYKVSERIREINTKKASPKSAMDFDVANGLSRGQFQYM
eukprot:scaffold25998_cov50-Cyclotella_meneghiniana.AAC.1